MSESLRHFGRRLRGDARGLTTVEYTIVLCLIAALCVGVWKTFGGQVKEHISGSGNKINENVSAYQQEDNGG